MEEGLFSTIITIPSNPNRHYFPYQWQFSFSMERPNVSGKEARSIALAGRGTPNTIFTKSTALADLSGLHRQ
jgi:hypothetical protein